MRKLTIRLAIISQLLVTCAIAQQRPGEGLHGQQNDHSTAAKINLPSFTELIRKPVSYIEVTYAQDGATMVAKATCFFIRIEDKRLPANSLFGYVVTNRIEVVLVGSRVGEGALTRWPPSATQTARADFPHAAFTKA
jgi:hypothetical protein